MLTHSTPDDHITWATVDDYVTKVKGRVMSASPIYFIQECKPLNVNWVLAYLWCGIRTQWWSSREWYSNNDVGNIGGMYQTMREATRVACQDFNKFNDTSEIKEQSELEIEYQKVIDYALQRNPNAKQPIVMPPDSRPASDGNTAHSQAPLSPSPQPQTITASWKLKMASWLGALTAVVFVVKMFLPGMAGNIIDLVLQVLKAIVGS